MGKGKDQKIVHHNPSSSSGKFEKAKTDQNTVHHSPSSSGKSERGNKDNSRNNNVPGVEKVILPDMLVYDKLRIYVDDEFGAEKAFRETICRLRCMVTDRKTDFQGIRCIGKNPYGFPLVELEIIIKYDSESGKPIVSTKILISKKDLYVIAFQECGIWRQFLNMAYTVYMDEETEVLYAGKGNYTSEPWEKIGPLKVIEAVSALNRPIKGQERYKLVQVFFVHFCEAARLRLIEEIVCRSFGPLGHLEFDKVEDEEDICNVLQAKAHIHEYHFYRPCNDENGSFKKTFENVDLNGYLDYLIHRWGTLSHEWIAYSLRKEASGSGQVSWEIGSDYRMKYAKSVKASLGVLCRPNVHKLLDELKRNVTVEEFKVIEKKLEKLGDLKLI